MNYTCGDGETGKTTPTGEFSCKFPPVTFKIGNLVLGTIDAFTADNKVFPQDLVGIPRHNFTHPELIKLIRLLQSLDADGVIDTAIVIPPEVDTLFLGATNEMTLEELAILAGVTLVSEDDAIIHLTNSMALTTYDFNSTFSHELDDKEFWLSQCFFHGDGDEYDDYNIAAQMQISFKNGLGRWVA